MNVIDDDNVSENTTFSSQKIALDFWEKTSGSRIIEKITVENIGTLLPDKENILRRQRGIVPCIMEYRRRQVMERR